MSANADNELLAAALVGYQAQLETIDQKIQELRRQIGGSETVAVASDVATPKRKMSAAGKARIVAALKKRWAAFHKGKAPKAPAKKTTRKKRVISAAAKKRISEATKKRWVAFRAQKEAAAKKAPAKKAATKRKLSPSRKAALVANLAKARAAKAAKKTTGEAVPF